MFRLFKPKVRLPREVLDWIKALPEGKKKETLSKVNLIVKKLNHPNTDENIDGMKTLAQLESPIAIPLFVQMLKSPSWALRGHAAIQCIDIAKKNPERSLELVGCLGGLLKKEKVNDVVSLVAPCLGKLGNNIKNPALKYKLNSQIMSHLQWLLKKHKDPNVKYFAVRGLGNTEDERAVRPLINALKQPELGESVVNELIEISRAFEGREVSDPHAEALQKIAPHLQSREHPSVVKDVFHAVLKNKIKSAKEIELYVKRLKDLYSGTTSVFPQSKHTARINAPPAR